MANRRVWSGEKYFQFSHVRLNKLLKNEENNFLCVPPHPTPSHPLIIQTPPPLNPTPRSSKSQAPPPNPTLDHPNPRCHLPTPPLDHPNPGCHLPTSPLDHPNPATSQPYPLIIKIPAIPTPHHISTLYILLNNI